MDTYINDGGCTNTIYKQYACQREWLLEFLLKEKADPNLETQVDSTVLTCASETSENGHYQVIELLRIC